jgi:predicted nucleotidyltransferase
LSNTYRETLASAIASAELPGALEEVHIFGSAQRHDDPEDVDVLLVYAPGHAESAVRRIADPIRDLLEPRVDRPLDFLLLSREEMEQTQFAILEGSELVWRRS